jgi:hypothetical protein
MFLAIKDFAAVWRLVLAAVDTPSMRGVGTKMGTVLICKIQVSGGDRSQVPFKAGLNFGVSVFFMTRRNGRFRLRAPDEPNHKDSLLAAAAGKGSMAAPMRAA